MALPYSSEFWTKEITEETLVIIAGMCFRAISITNISAVTGTVTGGYTVLGVASGDLTLRQGQTMVFGAAETAAVLEGITIDAPAGCTIQIIGEI